MRNLTILLIIGVIVLGVEKYIVAQTITTTVFPLYADSTGIEGKGTSFAVYVTITDWTEVKDTIVNVKVSVTSGSNFYIWNGTEWKNAQYFSNCPIEAIDFQGNWSGWLYLRVSKATDNNFKATARKVGATTGTITESSLHSLMYIDMSTTGSWIYATAASITAGKAVIAFDDSDNIIGTYAIEDNGVDEGYSTTAGYFKMAVPAGISIPKLQARNADNSIFNTQTGNWSSGSAGSETDLDVQEDVSLPVSLQDFTAIPGDHKVTLSWVTESETENLGFNLYRSTQKGSGFELINKQLIPGHGSSSERHEYSYVDCGVINGVTYYYKLEDVDYAGVAELHGTVVSATPVNGESDTKLNGFRLYSCYPNPFNPETTLRFELGEAARVTIQVFDLQGKQVTVLTDETYQPGAYKIVWNGRDVQNRLVATGVYFLRLDCGAFSRVEKVVFLR